MRTTSRPCTARPGRRGRGRGRRRPGPGARGCTRARSRGGGRRRLADRRSRRPGDPRGLPRQHTCRADDHRGAAGPPVLCEKPLIPAVTESRRVLEAVRRQGGPLVTVGFMRRLVPAYAALRPHGRTACTQRGFPCTASAEPSARQRARPARRASRARRATTSTRCRACSGSPITGRPWPRRRSSAAAHGLQDPQLLLLGTADGVLTTVRCSWSARSGRPPLQGDPHASGTDLRLDHAHGRSTSPPGWPAPSPSPLRSCATIALVETDRFPEAFAASDAADGGSIIDVGAVVDMGGSFNPATGDGRSPPPWGARRGRARP